MTPLTDDELLTLTPRLRAIAGAIHQRDPRLECGDLLQVMYQAALERATWPEQRTISYIAQYCRYVALHYKRAATYTGQFAVEPLPDQGELVADFDADPEAIIIEHEDHAAVQSWFEKVLTSSTLTPAERRTLAEMQSEKAGRGSDRARRTPSQRASKSYHVRNLRAKFPHPLVTA